MLTAKSADPDIVTGLQAGADDYVTKPFSMAQLHHGSKRCYAVQRRFRKAALRRGSAARAETTQSHSNAAASAHTWLMMAPTHKREHRRRDRSGSASTSNETRLSQGLTLHQVERACKIRWEFLQAIEHENWEYVPRKELRRALPAYTKYLGIDLVPSIGHRRKSASSNLPLPCGNTGTDDGAAGGGDLSAVSYGFTLRGGKTAHFSPWRLWPPAGRK